MHFQPRKTTRACFFQHSRRPEFLHQRLPRKCWSLAVLSVSKHYKICGNNFSESICLFVIGGEVIKVINNYSQTHQTCGTICDLRNSSNTAIYNMQIKCESILSVATTCLEYQCCQISMYYLAIISNVFCTFVDYVVFGWKVQVLELEQLPEESW